MTTTLCPSRRLLALLLRYLYQLHPLPFCLFLREVPLLSLANGSRLLPTPQQRCQTQLSALISHHMVRTLPNFTVLHSCRIVVLLIRGVESCTASRPSPPPVGKAAADLDFFSATANAKVAVPKPSPDSSTPIITQTQNEAVSVPVRQRALMRYPIICSA